MTALASDQKVFRLIFAVIVFGLLLFSSLLIISPFIPAITWSVMIVVASWPLMLKVQAWLNGRRGLAVTVMTIVMLLVFILPMSVALFAVINHVDEITQFITSIINNGIPKAPNWLIDVPVIGKSITNTWNKAVTAGGEEAMSKFSPYIGRGFSWFVSQLGSAGLLFVHFLLTIIFSAILFYRGESAAAASLKFANRFAGAQGINAVILAAKAVRAVALGVIVTAIIQSFLAGVGFIAIGLPYSSILSAIVFFLSVIQIGAAPVLIFALIWAYSYCSNFMFSAFIIWSILIMLSDNFVRPLLIRAGADIPLLIIFIGVVGGLLSMGIVGLFLGPVLLAVTYTLLRAWMNSNEAQA